MANVDWYIEGLEFGNCNCDYGCPCQFEALPTHGDCRGFEVTRIDRGHFGEVKLEGLDIALMRAWMTTKLSMSTMKPTSAPIREVSGAFCPRPSTSELTSRAQMATLMAATNGHPGNAGFSSVREDRQNAGSMGIQERNL